jgi:murein DD-endopeptidase MepM/ murein hydrolase activator NlpD
VRAGLVFPERQILVRESGRIRTFTLGSFHQLGIFAGIVIVVVWSAVAALAFVHGRAVAAASHDEMARRAVEMTGVQADYRAAFASLDQFETVFSDVACDISDIQNGLLRIADHGAAFAGRESGALAAARGNPVANDCRATASRSTQTLIEAAVQSQAGSRNDPPASAKPEGNLPDAEALRVRVQRLTDGIERLKQTHAAFIAQSAEIASRRVSELERTLTRVGVDAKQLGVAASGKPDRNDLTGGPFGTGGPFVPAQLAPPGAPRAFDPVALFNDHTSRLDNLVEALRALPLTAPLAEYEITSPFGAREDPFNEEMGFHEGLDLGAPTGTPVLATGDGHIVWAGWRSSYGMMVEIDHGHGIHTRYAHLSRVLVKMGQTVRRGRPIGLLGSTGRSTGPHLHYEVRTNDRPIDPLKFIGVGQDVFKGQ